MIDCIQMLKHYFRNVNDVHVSGNLLMYYEEGNPRKSVSPDVFVAFGVSKKRRRVESELAEALSELNACEGR